MIETGRRLIIGSVVLALLILAACHGKEGPLGPSGVTPPPVQPAPAPAPAPPSTPYTISGVVTAYRGGPVEGISVELIPSGYGRADVPVRTDAQGHYRLEGRQGGRAAVGVWSPADAATQYATQYKYDLPTQDQRVDFVVHPKVALQYGGDTTLTGVIHGDQFIGDDELGGRCASIGCIVVDFECCGPHRATAVQLTLSWADPSRQLVFYIPDFEYLPRSLPVPPAARVCCGSPLTTVYTFNADFDRIVIGFESVNGAPPGPNDLQTFQLTAVSR
jgi:hypothetical protein